MLNSITELRQAYADKLEKFNDIKMTGEMEEVRSLNEELKELKERISIAEEERELNKPQFIPTTTSVIDDVTSVRDLTLDELDREYEKTFLRAFRQQQLSQRDHDVYNRVVEVRDVPNTTPYFQSAVGVDGGFIVPHSVSTMINEYKREGEFDLTTLVDVQRTSLLSGEFTYEKLGTIKPWVKVSQWENIPEVETPQFERKEFKIEDYAGILPIPRTLLQDTDQNLLSYIAKYIARKTLVTRNGEILTTINATFTDKTDIVDVDDIKTALNVTLDPAFSRSAKFITNQDGYNVLDLMKDQDGNYLLQDDVTVASGKTLQSREVIVVPNRELPSESDKAPLLIGDLEEAIRFYDRGVYEVTPTTIGGDSFKRNSYDIRVIDRFDVIALDSEAVVYGELSLAGDVAP